MKFFRFIGTLFYWLLLISNLIIVLDWVNMKCDKNPLKPEIDSCVSFFNFNNKNVWYECKKLEIEKK